MVENNKAEQNLRRSAGVIAKVLECGIQVSMF